MRNLLELIDQLTAIVPPSQRNIFAVLRSHRSSVECSAPEQMQLRWEMLQEDVTAEFAYANPKDMEDWQVEFIRIWTNNPNFTRESVAG